MIRRLIVTLGLAVLGSAAFAQEQAELKPEIPMPKSRLDAGGLKAERNVGAPKQDTAASAPSVATAHKKSKEDLPNFHQVHPYLYRGGEPTAQGIKELKDMGIKTIIDLRGSEAQVRAEADQAKKLGMKSINLPMSSKPPTQKQIDVLIKTISDAEKDPLKGPVFVHCAHGSDRAGTMIGLWRVMHDNWDYDTTYKEMRKYWFTPKFTELSGTVRKFAEKKSQERQSAATATH